MQLARLKMQPDADIICCENPQGLLPARGSVGIGTYFDSGMTAGIAYNGDCRLIALPFIMESTEDFPALYRSCLHYLK
jgi:hypothetical protein